MRWYKQETEFCIRFGFFMSIFMWMFETDFSGSMDYIFDQFIYFAMLAFIVVFAFKLFSKKNRNTNITNPQKSKPFLPAHVKTQAEKEYHKLVRKFKSKHKRNPSNNECVKIAIKTSHNIDTHKGSKGHMRRQKVRKHLVLKYKLRDKFTMSKPKGN
jgi:hypothetical protein